MSDQTKASSNQSDMVTISKAQLAEMIADALKASQQQVTNDNLAVQIGTAVAKALSETREPAKVRIGQYLRRGGHSPFHPKPHAETPKFERKYFQNGAYIEHATTRDSEIELLNQITHSGRYINRLVEVVVRDEGAEQWVDIRFNNKIEGQLELKGFIRNFEDMLKQIVEAQKAEDAEQEEVDLERRTRPGRSFGNRKSTLEAEARAAERA